MGETPLQLGTLVLEHQDDVSFTDVSDIAIDSEQNLYLLTRDQPSVVVYGPDGAFHGSWRSPAFVLPHGITIDADDRVQIVDQGEHTARTYSREGELLSTWGTPGQPSATGLDWDRPTYKERYLSIERGGPPFNNPTKVAIAPNGDRFVSDGYGNTRVHRFSRDGKLLQSWGEPGSEPGQFRLPHSVCVLSDGRVVVADRENDRIQVFTHAGELLDIWTAVQRPIALVCDDKDRVFVAEMAWRVGDYSFVSGPVTEPLAPRFTVLDNEGSVLAQRVLDRADPSAGRWRPHGLSLDGRGGCYLAQLDRLPVASGDPSGDGGVPSNMRTLATVTMVVPARAT